MIFFNSGTKRASTSLIASWLARSLRLIHEHLAIPDDGVHGGAQFVAHVGEELALGLVGGFGGLHQYLEFVMALFQLGVGACQFLAGEAEAARHVIEGARQVHQFVLAESTMWVFRSPAPSESAPALSAPRPRVRWRETTIARAAARTPENRKMTTVTCR